MIKRLVQLIVLGCGLCGALFSSVIQAKNALEIHVNQSGYLTQWPKLAMLTSNQPLHERILLVNSHTDETIAALIPSDPQKIEDGRIAQFVQFSQITQSGTYYLLGKDTRSQHFRVGEGLFESASETLLRSYYLQRCGISLSDDITRIEHKACHTKDGYIFRSDKFNPQGRYIDANGGWHDAGDYGKYITTTAVTLGRLLSLYLERPSRFTDGQLNIPESGNGIPDILDESAVGLNWMLKMQRQDGAVYRKLSGLQWPPIVTPDQDSQRRYVFGVSSPETGKFAGAMALAARAFKKHQPKRAAHYLKAAEKAWQYLEKHPKMFVDWQKEDDGGSGKYLASEVDEEAALFMDTDDRFWAASELYLATGKKVYLEFIRANVSALPYTLFEWKDPTPLGMWHLLTQGKPSELDWVREDIKKKLLNRANENIKKRNLSPHRLANHRFVWGSNKMAAEEGITLVYAYRLTGDFRFRDAAVDQLDYLLGRNAFGISFVTGVGIHPVQNVHHIFEKASSYKIPGLLVGGPNYLAQANIAPKHLGALSYLDDHRSYATNEYAIDYNAAIIALIETLLAQP